MAKLIVCFLVATILCAYICAGEEAVKGDEIEHGQVRLVREASPDADPRHKGKGHNKGYDKGYKGYKGNKGYKGHY